MFDLSEHPVYVPGGELVGSRLQYCRQLLVEISPRLPRLRGRERIPHPLRDGRSPSPGRSPEIIEL